MAMRCLVLVALACGTSPMTPAQNHVTTPPKHEIAFRLPPEGHDSQAYAQTRDRIGACIHANRDRLEAFQRRLGTVEHDPKARERIALECKFEMLSAQGDAVAANCKL